MTLNREGSSLKEGFGAQGATFLSHALKKNTVLRKLNISCEEDIKQYQVKKEIIVQLIAREWNWR